MRLLTSISGHTTFLLPFNSLPAPPEGLHRTALAPVPTQLPLLATSYIVPAPVILSLHTPSLASQPIPTVVDSCGWWLCHAVDPSVMSQATLLPEFQGQRAISARLRSTLPARVTCSCARTHRLASTAW